MNIKIINEYDAFDLIRTSQPTAQLSSVEEEEEWVGCDSCSKWPVIGHVHYRDGRDSRFADAGGIAERVAFCRYN